MPDNDGILNNDLYVSQISINSNVLKIKDTDARDDINDITLAIVANNEAIGSRINDLNTRLSGVQTTLTTEYAISTETGLALGLQSGDTYDEAFGKLEKSISDNERVTAAALNDLNDRIDEIPTAVKPDWNAASGSDAEILNKPDLSNFITSIKTVNNESLVGTGNINISGLPAVTSADNGKILMVVNGQWQLVSPSVLYSGSGIPNNANGNNGDLYMQTN